MCSRTLQTRPGFDHGHSRDEDDTLNEKKDKPDELMD